MRPRLQFVPTHLSVFAWVWVPSRLVINRTLWTAGLVLQCALAVAVFRRGIARRFPCFAVLICFYPLRAALLFALAGRVDPDVYNPLFSALSFVETALLAAVVLELLWRIVQEMGGATASPMRRGIPILLLLLCAASLLTWLALKFMPAHAPLDRVQVFLWFVMIAVFAIAVKSARSTNVLRIAAGFAAFSLIQLATSYGRAHAYLRHDAHWYLAWSYAPAVAYLTIVSLWLCRLAKEP
jgi:hypothetical protein